MDSSSKSACIALPSLQTDPYSASQPTCYSTAAVPRGYTRSHEFISSNGTPVMWDADDGYVNWTSIRKALGWSKRGEGRKLALAKALEDVERNCIDVRRVRGGILKIQGSWIPKEHALEAAISYCWPIRHELVPVFGESFPGLVQETDLAWYLDVPDSSSSHPSSPSTPVRVSKSPQRTFSLSPSPTTTTASLASPPRTSTPRNSRPPLARVPSRSSNRSTRASESNGTNEIGATAPPYRVPYPIAGTHITEQDEWNALLYGAPLIGNRPNSTRSLRIRHSRTGPSTYGRKDRNATFESLSDTESSDGSSSAGNSFMDLDESQVVPLVDSRRGPQSRRVARTVSSASPQRRTVSRRLRFEKEAAGDTTETESESEHETAWRVVPRRRDRRPINPFQDPLKVGQNERTYDPREIMELVTGALTLGNLNKASDDLVGSTGDGYLSWTKSDKQRLAPANMPHEFVLDGVEFVWRVVDGVGMYRRVAESRVTGQVAQFGPTHFAPFHAPAWSARWTAGSRGPAPMDQ